MAFSEPGFSHWDFKPRFCGGGAPWQLALQLFQKSSVDAISISSMVAIQEEMTRRTR